MPTPPKTKPQKAYANAGVDVDLGNRVKAGLARRVKTTHRPEVLSSIGGFGGLFAAQFPHMQEPVLVSSIDGVGTKLRIAQMANRHDTIGADLVNHCINDIAVLGAEPLFFLDYIGTAKLHPPTFSQIIEGIVKACRTAGCTLIGGETAQMPGLYHGADYDLVGTIIGVVDRKKIITGQTITPGDVIIGFPSSGLHTNGYSLARNILFEKEKLKITDYLPGTRRKISAELLKTHINYQPLLKRLATKTTIKGLAHITGGGFLDNIPRILPPGTAAHIQLGTWPILPIFEIMSFYGAIEENELYQVFNMGIGMVAILSPADAAKTLTLTKAYTIGRITKGNQTVTLHRSQYEPTP